MPSVPDKNKTVRNPLAPVRSTRSGKLNIARISRVGEADHDSINLLPEDFDPGTWSEVAAQQNTLSLNDAIAAVQNEDRPIPAKAIYALSDLTEADQKVLAIQWATIPLERRRTLIDRLTDAAEADFNLDFSRVVRVAMTDLDDELREAAVEASWMDESISMFNWLMSLSSVDPAMLVRAAAVSNLGRFIYAAEVGSFPKVLGVHAETLTLQIWNNLLLDLEVRRRALEALSNSSRPEVLDMIKTAYNDRESRMKASAIHAMGRSCDDQWTPAVLFELKSDDPMMRYEAAKAAGELEVSEAVSALGELLSDDDREIMEMAIWSLGEIGSNEAKRYLMNVAEHAQSEGDESLVEAVEEAIASANLVGGNLIG